MSSTHKRHRILLQHERSLFSTLTLPLVLVSGDDPLLSRWMPGQLRIELASFGLVDLVLEIVPVGKESNACDQ